MGKQKINFKVNGKSYSIDVLVGETLLDVLRDKLNLKGTKKGCSVGECGACTVEIDGKTIDSCLYLAIWADGKSVVTIEGIEKNNQLNKVQKAYLKHGAIQCGFCSPGFIVQTTNILKNKNIKTREDIRRNLAGNMCRCTGYEKIVDAVEELILEDFETNIIDERKRCNFAKCQ